MGEERRGNEDAAGREIEQPHRRAVGEDQHARDAETRVRREAADDEERHRHVAHPEEIPVGAVGDVPHHVEQVEDEGGEASPAERAVGGERRDAAHNPPSSTIV
jgi:hypothetical protein